MSPTVLSSVYPGGMPEPVGLKPPTPDDLAEALAYALRYRGGKRVRDSGEVMARIVAVAAWHRDVPGPPTFASGAFSHAGRGLTKLAVLDDKDLRRALPNINYSPLPCPCAHVICVRARVT